MAQIDAIDRGRSGEELRGIRERLGLSRAALAARCGHSPAWIAALEAGVVPRRSAVRDGMLRALREAADALNDHDPSAQARVVEKQGVGAPDVKSY